MNIMVMMLDLFILRIELHIFYELGVKYDNDSTGNGSNQGWGVLGKYNFLFFRDWNSPPALVQLLNQYAMTNYQYYLLV